MTIDTVALEAGVSRSMVNRMELGRALQTPIGSWARVADAVQLELFSPGSVEHRWGLTEVATLAGVGGWKPAPHAIDASALRLVRPPHFVPWTVQTTDDAGRACCARRHRRVDGST